MVGSGVEAELVQRINCFCISVLTGLHAGVIRSIFHLNALESSLDPFCSKVDTSGFFFRKSPGRIFTNVFLFLFLNTAATCLRKSN